MPAYSQSSQTTSSQPRTVTAVFNYWSRTAVPPQDSELQDIFHGRSKNLQPTKCTVTDIRSLPQGLATPTLSKTGFQILKHSSALLPPQSDSVPDMHDKTVAVDQYWPELATMLKCQLGVRSAVGINTTVRDAKEAKPGDLDAKNPRQRAKTSFQPFFVVHGDYTSAGARSYCRALVPETFFNATESIKGTTAEERAEFFKLREEIIAAEEQAMKEEGVTDQWDWSGKNYQGPRWGVLSVWRPLETVHADPLAVLDPSSFLRPDVEKPYIAIQRDYANRPGFVPSFRMENVIACAPEEGKDHRWYYLSKQKPEEVYALKLFDSEAIKEGSDDAVMAAHSAFASESQDGEVMRRSCEVRFLVIW